MSELLDLADIMEKNGVDHASFSSRQNFQMHGIPPDKIDSALAAFENKEIIFKASDVHTFRSPAGSPYAGISKTEVFDTTPYARALCKYLFDCKRACDLGRKFKVGFSSECSDNANCGIQDLGFMAVLQDGQRGFKLYGGGGLGRNGELGLVLVPFLPAARVLQAAQAAVNLFYDHGDLENRSKARLRFVREKLGSEEYRKLYNEYLNNADAPLLEDISEIDYLQQVERVVVFQDVALDSVAYRGWLRRAVQTTKFDNVVAVRLYMRGSRFSAQELRTLATILEKIGAPGLRLTVQQDAVVPFVHCSALPVLYRALREQLPEQAVMDGSFQNQIISCAGARLCTRGLADSTSAAEAIATSMDELFAEYTDIRDEVFEGILDGVRVSGCGNSCGLNQIAALGFNGHRKRIDGILTEIFQIHIGGDITEEGHYFAVTHPDWWITSADIGPFVAVIIKGYLDDYRSGNPQSLRKYMLQQRDASFDDTVKAVESVRG